MRRLRLATLAAGLALVAGLGLTACAAEPVAVGSDTVVIDVRTPDEYASGHLEGAINIDLQSGAFEQEVQQLPVDGEYVVYCRSGNRSAQAASIMAGLGFVNVTDAGGIQSASGATGLAIVTG